MNDITGFLSAFVLSFILTAVLRPVARRFDIVDYPVKGKAHSIPTPLLGGAALYISFTALTLAVFKTTGGAYRALFAAGAVIFLVGLLDDIKPLPATVRLLIQLGAAGFIISRGISFTFLPDTALGRFCETALTLIWIVGMINAFNYLDGLNGLLSGIAIINAAFFFVFTSISGQHVLGYVLLVFAGACCGFFPHNFPKGRIFMGNAGSSWIGFMLAGLAVMGNWAEDNPVDMVAPVLIFGVPIFDMVTTTVGRIAGGKVKGFVELLEYKGKDHFHYRLSLLGLGNKGAVLFIFLTCIFLGLNAILLVMSASVATALISLCIGFIFFAIVSLLMAASFERG